MTFRASRSNLFLPAAARGKVRAYRLRDVFDATVILLTPAQWRLVVDSPAVPEDERPEVA